MFGDGHAAAHPQMVLAVMNTAATDWAARVITAGLQDIAVALVEGVEPPGPAGLVAARSTLVRP